MWYENCTFYQIYPLGFCNAPPINTGVEGHELQRILSWIPHMQNLGIGALLLNPILESDAHGYDTRDFSKIDVRLGSNQEFAQICKLLHAANIKVVLDGVFNHVGRGFWAFEDVKKNREDSRYKDWFYIDFNGNSNYDDGFWYEGWEGHFELVKLNLNNYEVVEYLLNCVSGWIKEFGIDGIRLDVAYSVNQGFMKRLRKFTKETNAEFFLLGEMLHGDYKTIVNDEMLDSATNYECYKGMYSSLNSLNFFEISYSLNRQFGEEDWSLYKKLPLLNFVDNHDVTRAASILENQNHLPLLYGMLFGIPGIPCIYYGSEWGTQGVKQEGSDAELRPYFEAPQENDFFELIKKMVDIRKKSNALCKGEYFNTFLTNKQFIFSRVAKDETLYIALNAEENEFYANCEFPVAKGIDLLTGNEVSLLGGVMLPSYSVQFIKI